MQTRFHTVHDGRRSLEQGFADLVTRKQLAANSRQAHGHTAESPAEVFDAVCSIIGQSIEPDGYRYSRSGHKSSKRLGDLVFELRYSSDLYNVAGVHVLLSISGAVRSRRFKEWQRDTGFPNPSDLVAGGQIGYFCPDHLELVWELADPESRPAVTRGAVQAVRELAIPWFESFSDTQTIRRRLIDGNVPSVQITGAINFLMHIASRDEAAAAGRAFLSHRPDLIALYKQEFRQIRDRAPLRVHGQGYAKELAIVSRFFDLGELA